MKNLLVFLFLLTSVLTFGQGKIVLINPNKNVYDIMIWKNDRLIHSHIMSSNDQLEIDVTPFDTIKVQYKKLTNFCDIETMDEKKWQPCNCGSKTSSFSRGTAILTYDTSFTDWIRYILGGNVIFRFSPIYCKQA